MRESDLQGLIDAVHAAFVTAALPASPVGAMTTRFFDAARREVGQCGVRSIGDAPPVCRYLDEALAQAATASAQTALVASAFARLAPRLTWRERVTSPNAPAGFAGHHANATLIGVDGLEVRDDIRLGASLVAPGVTYPDHEHPPEEIYLVLSDGEWRNAAQDWHEPGIGGTVHNPPGIVHAMRAGKTPLFAVWCLLAD